MVRRQARCSASPRAANFSRWRKPAPFGSLLDARRGAAQAMTADEFFARARARLTLDVPAGMTDPAVTPARGDHDADPVMEKIAAVRPIRPAAVLVPIVDHPEPTVLLTQRAQHLPDHAGQVSFPGGKIDKSDDSPLASALREADEEIGLSAHIRRAARLSRSLHDHARLPHRAGGGAGEARLFAHAQHQRGGRQLSRCRSPS